MSNSYNEITLRRKVESCLEKVRLILNSQKTNSLLAADQVPHQYQDKYLLAIFLTEISGACFINCLKLFGLTSSQLQLLQKWSSSRDVSLRFITTESCEFIREASREVDSDGKYVTEKSFGSQVLSIITSKIVTTVIEYDYTFKVHYELVAFRGVGDSEDDRILLLGHDSQQSITKRSKDMPYPEKSSNNFDVNISWLMRSLDESTEQVSFSLDRAHKDCHTPRRNADIEAVEKFYFDFGKWASKVSHYFTKSLFPVQTTYGSELTRPDFDVINANGLFVPVVPLFDSHSDGNVSTAIATSEADGTVAVSTTAAPVTLDIITAKQLLSEHERMLQVKCDHLSTLYTTTESLVSAVAAKIVTVCFHIADIVGQYSNSIVFIEDMLRKQLIAAVGKELQPADFGAYMQFHNRKLFRPEFQPTPFTHSVRRSVTHSPEGTVRIEDTSAGGSTVSVAEPINTLCCSSTASSVNKMEFTLNAATKVRFGGERHVHGWLAHSFSHQSLPQLSLVAQARQFSSFIVLVGRIASATLFEPKHAFIVQNKDEMIIPLLLETIPTPKEFRDAIESLSPEQQRFAKAFRSMQLESTLFGVCIIQIKPQLEKVLNLAPDSLTKEIQLTQDLMRLFIEFQIPTDLMSFEGDKTASASERLSAVKGHVKTMMDMLNQAKEQEIKDANAAREYAHGPIRLQSAQRDYEFEGFTYKEQAEQIQSVRDVMRDNIDHILTRSENLESLGSMELSAGVFKKNAAQVKRKSSGMSFSGLFGSSGGSSGSKGGGGMFSSSPAPVMGFSGATMPSSTSKDMKLKKSSVVVRARSPMQLNDMQSEERRSEVVKVKPSSVAVTTTTSTATNVPVVHVVVNKPSEAAAHANASQSQELNEKDVVISPIATSDAEVVDYTKIPTQLDENYEKYDKESALRPTIINVGTSWTKKSQAALLSKQATKTLDDATEQTSEKTAAFDLLDALSRSGALCIEDASLHVVIAATHSFDQSLMDTVVKGNVNPIERVERSTLIMASTLHGVSASELVSESQLSRVATYAPALFIKDDDDFNGNEDE